ncbi:MAG TPA: TlpA disulfide reductase family protein [Aestuariivirga sp.]|nr:TlpA disulfide reductase family protein [Aestuariivirga sp.]
MNKTPKPLPEIHFTDGTGKARTLEEFKGKVVLLNIWATWCAPCRKEMPTLDRLQVALGGPDFEVLPLSIDSKGLEAVNKFYAETGVEHLSHYVAPSAGEAFDKLGIFGLPETFLIDRQGQELGRRAGPAEWDSPEMTAFLKNVIAQEKEKSP